MIAEPTTLPLRSISWPLAFAGKSTCASAGDGERIADAKQDRRDDGHQNRDDEIASEVHVSAPTPAAAS